MISAIDAQIGALPPFVIDRCKRQRKPFNLKVRFAPMELRDLYFSPTMSSLERRYLKDTQHSNCIEDGGLQGVHWFPEESPYLMAFVYKNVCRLELVPEAGEPLVSYE